MARKFKLVFFSVFLIVFYTFLIGAALSPTLPTPGSPLIFYSNQQRDDFRLLLQKAFRQAISSINIIVYAITDPLLIKKLYQRAREGVEVQIAYDHSSGSTSFTPPLTASPVKAKGLMHRKIVVIDESLVFLGSVNMTTASLILHDNLSVGIYHPPLAQFINKPGSTTFDFFLRDQPCRLWLLPDPTALPYLKEQLKQARSSIFLAMFTLTHPELLELLVEAHQRGIQVTVAVDSYTARGASRKAVKYLLSHQIQVVCNQGLQLLHYKWAYIDRSHVILGSTNWTKAAFVKNQDCLLFLKSLTKKDRLFFDNLCRTILLESKKAT